MPSQATLLGAAGEHYVLSQLLRRGYIAALAPQGVPNADIIITDLVGQRLCAIQVKTRRDIGVDKGWHMKQKHERLVSNWLFYCFVDLGSDFLDRTTTYVVPSDVVATALSDSHRKWLETPGMHGQPHKDGVMRRFLPDYSKIFGPEDTLYRAGWIDKYRESWHLLGSPTLTETVVEPTQEE